MGPKGDSISLSAGHVSPRNATTCSRHAPKPYHPGLGGHPGIRKHIGDFVGLEVTKGKHLRILLRVVDVLSSHGCRNLVSLWDNLNAARGEGRDNAIH